MNTKVSEIDDELYKLKYYEAKMTSGVQLVLTDVLCATKDG